MPTIAVWNRLNGMASIRWQQVIQSVIVAVRTKHSLVQGMLCRGIPSARADAKPADLSEHSCDDLPAPDLTKFYNRVAENIAKFIKSRAPRARCTVLHKIQQGDEDGSLPCHFSSPVNVNVHDRATKGEKKGLVEYR